MRIEDGLSVSRCSTVGQKGQTEPYDSTAHKAVLDKGGVARYNMTRVELKSFTFSSGSQSLSIDNAVLGPVPKQIIFTMIRKKDFLGSIDTNP